VQGKRKAGNDPFVAGAPGHAGSEPHQQLQVIGALAPRSGIIGFDALQLYHRVVA
jgi:hypothetical protein